MIHAEDDPEISFIPFDKLTDPPEGLAMVRRNRWWVVHPQKGLVMFRKTSPQCNADQNVANKVQKKLYPWGEVRFIPLAITAENPSDWSCP